MWFSSSNCTKLCKFATIAVHEVETMKKHGQITPEINQKQYVKQLRNNGVVSSV